MKRIDCLQAIYEDLAECAVVTIMGAVAADMLLTPRRNGLANASG